MSQLEVTQAESELLFEALEAWEETPKQEGFITAMISVITAKNPTDVAGREQSKNQIMAESKQESLRRKRRSIMLKAKLIQSLEQKSVNSLFNAIDATVEPE